MRIETLWLGVFKKVNDTYGHDAGDNVLKTFANILKTHTRQSDICARLGGEGEEFLLMMTRTDKEGITAVERIRKQFENTKFAFEDSIFTEGGCPIEVASPVRGKPGLGSDAIASAFEVVEHSLGLGLR
jgi:diguanylate cyclase (GGDEF)-like protein